MWRNARLVMATIDGNTPPDRLVDVEGPGPSADLPRPPIPRGGSILAGRGPLLLVGTGLLLVALASYLLMSGRLH